MRKTTLNGFSRIIGLLLVGGFLPVGLAVANGPSGKDLYNSKCAMCHGMDGVAKAMWAKQGAKNLNDPAWQKEKTDEDIAKVINDGLPEKKMPGYKGKLKPEEITAIVKHVRSLAPAK